jgi:RHS repeat-associated protein
MADGAKYASARADGSGYVYKGALVFERNAVGKLSLDAALTTGGRITAQKDASTRAITGYTVHHHITDHLGSVRAITDAGTGTVVETSDFLPFGTRWSQTSGSSSATITDATNRWRYSGKEEQKAIDAALPLIDYGARMYDPAIARWMSTDPLAEKYYPVGPYVYCAGNPVRYSDNDGNDWRDVINGFSSAVRSNLSPASPSEPISPVISNVSHYAIGRYLGDAVTMIAGATMMANGAATITGGAALPLVVSSPHQKQPELLWEFPLLVSELLPPARQHL